MKKKIAVFIDGSNLSKKLRYSRIEDTSRFNYKKFVSHLTKGKEPAYVGYYIGKVRKEDENEKSEELYERQQELFDHLESTVPNIEVIPGHIQNYNGAYQEKGVDVQIALDMYALARDNVYDKAILVSSDTDLIPAIQVAQEMDGKEVEYIGFSRNPSIALMQECATKRLLQAKDLKSFRS